MSHVSRDPVSDANPTVLLRNAGIFCAVRGQTECDHSGLQHSDRKHEKTCQTEKDDTKINNVQREQVFKSLFHRGYPLSSCHSTFTNYFLKSSYTKGKVANMERTTHPGFRQRQRQQMRMGRRARPRYENLNVLGGAAMVIERAPAAAPEAEVGAANADNEPERNVQLPPTPPHPYESSFHDWIHREQDEYQRQLGSTRWNTEERSIYVHPFGPLQFNSSFMLKRIRAYIGWAVHGLVFEFLDGKRVGYVSEVESIEDERGTSMRHPTDWVDIEPGDYVRKVHGFNLPVFGYLCHTIHFEMASGRTISFVSKFQPWKDTPFAHELPDNALLHYVSFRRGKCIGMTAVESCMQMPIRSLQRVKTLLKPWQDKYHFLQLLSYRVDCDLLKNGSRPPGVDLWNKVINEFLPCSDLQDRVTHESNEEREEEE